VKAMDTNAKARWVEVKAWYICQEILKNHNDLMELYAIVEGLASFGNYPAEAAKTIINEMLTFTRYKPNTEEYILLLYHADIPLSHIKAITKWSGKRLYKLFNDDKENPRGFYPRFAPPQTEILNKFVESIKNIGVCFNNVS
jgi:hypothetical protein